ncbi:protein N-terminal asparagine amidohydrolase isoform X3 [Apodemus sylvaticus]|uniref:protein N-terminal asparagine amidohydrolase isoform X3 n=1 Tax=Apodemus sylvaticus TaxID=10129 RepID=UPI0022422EAF|nr:protein N-terminal asparagine amidohydrolase isoform X3 [Apodemus sylvaticus]
MPCSQRAIPSPRSLRAAPRLPGLHIRADSAVGVTPVVGVAWRRAWRGGGRLPRPVGGLHDAAAGGRAARPSATIGCGAGPRAPASGGSISILGSDDATTCHIVVLRHTGNGATCLTHCDGSDTKAEVPLIMSAIKSFSEHAECGRLEVHLVGGFSDDRQLSQKLTHQLLSEFDKQDDDIHLVTLCVTELNDREENENHFPIIYGIAVNIKTAEIYRASFQDRGPEEQLRAARALAGGPNLSTSPLAEPPHFVEHIRSTLMFLKKFPSPENILFPGNKALLYKKNKDGLWERVSCPGS